MGISRFSLAMLISLSLLAACATVPLYDGPVLSAKQIAAESKVTVLFWWANECPCVARYQSRIEALQRRYAAQGVAFFAIASNSDDSSAQIEKISKQRNFQLPILHDAGARLARELGVRTTPTVVVLDTNGDVLYQGWIDNERFDGDAGRIAYLENALKDALTLSAVKTPTSPIYGCRITKRLR